MIFLLQFLVCSGSLLFLHQTPQVEKECGAKVEEDIGDSLKNHLRQFYDLNNDSKSTSYNDVYLISLDGRSFRHGCMIWVQSHFFSKTKPKVENVAIFPLANFDLIFFSRNQGSVGDRVTDRLTERQTR